MFIKNSPRIYILWIIPFINSPTSPFGGLEIRVINLWVSQEFPQRLPVDCSAGVYLLAVPNELATQDSLAISQMFCISPYTCQLVFKVYCKEPFFFFFFFRVTLISDRDEHIFEVNLTNFSWTSPLFDRLIKKIQCRVRIQLERDMAYHISGLGGRREVLPSGDENEPLLPLRQK